MEQHPCPICKTQATIGPLGDRDAFHVICPVCGRYNITGTLFASDISHYAPPFKVTAGLRSLHESNTIQTLSTTNIANIAELVNPPRDPIDAIDTILSYIVARSGRGDQFVDMEANTEYPIVCAENPSQFNFYLQKLGDLKYLEQKGNAYRLSLDGWERYASLSKKIQKSNKAFVAMWFDSSLEAIWREGIKTAIEAAGFTPTRIDLQQHNEKICDRIVAEIRSSAFVVADFTGQRGGVYYEAGYAMGLGIPVIWTVRRADIPNLHFDTRQYNHIAWDSPVDLQENLLMRIKATIPKSIHD
jgi:hypothetical protein